MERRWFRRERRGERRKGIWGEGGEDMVSRGRGWNPLGRFRGFSGSSAGSLGQIYGYIQSGRGRMRARGVLAVIYTVIRVHNANFNPSRRRCRHPQLVIRCAPIFRKSCPEYERNRRMKRRWGESKGEKGRSRLKRMTRMKGAQSSCHESTALETLTASSDDRYLLSISVLTILVDVQNI